MSDKFAEHFLMTAQVAKQYAKEKFDFFDKTAELSAEEIGDGNINYIFKIKDAKSGKSLVIKQADKLLRSSARPLGLQHNKIEAQMLKIQGSIVPQLVPKVYFYDENMCAIAMEDISSYKNLRTEMLKGKIFPHFAQDISEFMAKTLLATSDLVLDRAEKKQRVSDFTNIELCDISEDLVFTEPYDDYKNRNIITKQNLDFVRTQLYDDLVLKGEVAMLRNNFMNNAQAILHGDLHSGSIFIDSKGIKVIDPEFAFYGPMGYDIGNVLGNMFFALARNKFADNNDDFDKWATKSIEDIFDLFFCKLEKEFDLLVSFDLYKNRYFKKQYIKLVMKDAVGYAGTEIIRRTVGDSKVKELTSVTDPKIKIPMERSLILLGKRFILKRQEISCGAELTREFTQILKEI